MAQILQQALDSVECFFIGIRILSLRQQIYRMRKLLLLIGMLYVVQLSAQIQPLSGNKIAAYSYDPVPKNVLEFEPNFSAGTTSGFFNNDSETISGDSVFINSSLSWRLTYGFLDKFEFGLFTQNDFSNPGIGLKMVLIDDDKTGLSGMIGFNTPIGNRLLRKKNRNFNDLSSYGIGLVYTLKGEQFNWLDVNIQYQDYFRDLNNINPGGLFINADIGKLTENGRYIFAMGFGYQQTIGGPFSSYKFTLYPGVSLNFGKKYLFVVSTSHDIFGKNNQKNFGFNLAVTTSLE